MLTAERGSRTSSAYEHLVIVRSLVVPVRVLGGYRMRKAAWAIARALVAAVAVVSAGCATTGGAPTPGDVDAAIRARMPGGLRLEGQEPLPPDVNIADGLTQEEAVAIALWNSPSFQATLADLGIARADLAEAGLLRNPILSLLFPARTQAAGIHAAVSHSTPSCSARRVLPRRASTRRLSASGWCGMPCRSSPR